MLSLGIQFRLAVLTPSFSCIHSASEGADREALYRAFAAALILNAWINKEFGVDGVPQKIRELNAIRLPNVSRLRRWQKAEYLTFQIKKRYSISTQRQLYLAESNGQNILVKFVRRYCPELHSICAELGHAPSLLAYERLPTKRAYNYREYGTISNTHRRLSIQSSHMLSKSLSKNLYGARGHKNNTAVIDPF